MQWISIDHPHLWNGRKDPYLYHVRVTVADGPNCGSRDPAAWGFGSSASIRTKGFSSTAIPIRCTASTGIRTAWTWAGPSPRASNRRISISSWRWDARGIRLAHYQQAQEFYDLCDRGGLVVWAEACLVNEVVPTEAFDDTAKQQLRELIKQSYNHPSICFWALFNELGDKKEKGQTDAEGKAMLDAEFQLVTAVERRGPSARLDAADHRGERHKRCHLPIERDHRCHRLQPLLWLVQQIDGGLAHGP